MNNNIRMYRGKYKITQEELSIKLGVSRQTINSIENNKYFPSLELGLKLSKIFECKVDDLFSLDDPTTHPLQIPLINDSISYKKGKSGQYLRDRKGFKKYDIIDGEKELTTPYLLPNLFNGDQLDNQGWKTYMTLTKIFKTHQKDHSSIKFDINIEMIY